MQSASDPLQVAASLLRFVDDTATRTVQPGQGRRGEHGVIASGRVIPTVPEVVSSQSLSSTNLDATTPAPSSLASPHTPSHPFTPVRRVLRRKKGLTPLSRISKPAGIGRECRLPVVSRLLHEAKTIKRDAPDGCYVSPKGDDIFQWLAVLEGPPDSVYAGGTFFCNIHFSVNYPTLPPKVEFATRIYHCNVNAQGEICNDILNDKWKSNMSVRTVMITLMSLMYTCNPDSALVPSIAKQYSENRQNFDNMARIWTYRYAT